MSEDRKLLPFMGFEGERRFNTHYIVTFGNITAAVTWMGDHYRVFTWGSGWKSPAYDVPDELSALAVLYELRNTYGGNQ